MTKRDLLEQVWQDVCVEEGTLRVHIASLRKILGDGKDGVRYLENITGLGYRFVAPVMRVYEPRPALLGDVLAGCAR